MQARHAQDMKKAHADHMKKGAQMIAGADQMKMMDPPGKWIQGAVPKSNKGLLHKKLGVPQRQKIPAAKLNQAAKSNNSKLRHEAQFALNVKK